MSISVGMIPADSLAASTAWKIWWAVSKVFKRTPKVHKPTQGPTNSWVIFWADTWTRLAHTVYATMSLAQIAALDEKWMDRMARVYYENEKASAEEAGKNLDPNTNETAYRVQQVTRSIIKELRESNKYKDRYREIKDDITSGSGWKILTIDNPSMNAYCLPGGRMVVYSWLANKLNDDELAAVIWHEIMHAVKWHSYHRAKDSLMRNAAILWWAAITGAKALPVSLALLGQAFVSNTAFSRPNEKEADIEGLHIMRNAWYDPRGAITLWRKMAESQKNSGNIPEIFSSHPSHSTREEYLENEVNKMR